MAANSNDLETDWLEVIAKCLCFQCLNESHAKNDSVLEKAEFLKGFGLSRADCAAILGSTDKSLAELERQAKKKRGSKRATKKRR